MRFFEDVDGHGEDCIWVENGDNPIPILRRRHVGGAPKVFWPDLVRALTAGPTMESALVVVDVLREEIAELTAANRDLNAELTSLRRELDDKAWEELNRD